MVRVCALLFALAQFAQNNTGELRITVTGPDSLPLQATVDVASEANQVHDELTTDDRGSLVIKRLPFGRYTVSVASSGFSTFSGLIDIDSTLPTAFPVALAVAPLQAQVEVRAGSTLVDTHSPATVERIGRDTLQTRATSLPGRVLADLVATQPGWLLEANGVLHPRGSEYQTQYVIDGLPMTDNRSPAFAPDMGSDAAESLTILTGGYPAEYGRKLGGVVEVATAQSARLGVHGGLSADAGSFATAGVTGIVEYGWPHTQASVTAAGERTGRYLDPPVEENFTNDGSMRRLAGRLDHDFSVSDRFGGIVRYGRASFDVPNERVQQIAGQEQRRATRETAGQFSYQHFFPSAAADVRGMARRLGATLTSNTASIPIAAQQDRGFSEFYLNAAAAVHSGPHEWKVGGDLSSGRAREMFAYQLTDRAFFGPDVPVSFAFDDRRRDVEAALFIEDQLRVPGWTVNAGLRFDTYRFVVNDHAFSPRLGVAWSPTATLVLRASYDRAFQTPATENLLLASSPAVDVLSDQVARLPVRPSRGDFVQGGISKSLAGAVRMDVTAYRRIARNFADDDVLLNTGISFPIALDRGDISGAEVTVDLPRRGRWSGSAGYALMKGTARLPVTDGLLLGDEAGALVHMAETLPITQDERHTFRGRAAYQIHAAAWTALAVSYGSGLPFEFTGTRQDATAQYGSRIVNRVDFESGRVRPRLSLDASAGLRLRQRDGSALRLQLDVRNLTNRLDVINFAGLFSGTAVAPPRSAAVRLSAEF